MSWFYILGVLAESLEVGALGNAPTQDYKQPQLGQAGRTAETGRSWPKVERARKLYDEAGMLAGDVFN